MQLPGSPAKPPNQLLSRKSDGEGVFDFDGVLECEEEFTFDLAVDSDADSYYSDAVIEQEETNNMNDDVSDNDNGDNDEGETNSDDNNSADSDFSDSTYVQSDTTLRDFDNDSFSYDFEEDELSTDDESWLPNYTPRPFPDELVPISTNIYAQKSKKISTKHIAQLQIRISCIHRCTG